MAMVQVDLSEYDMLREAKNKAEEEVKELKETINGLKDKSRVILTTKYVYPKVNYERLVSSIIRLITEYKNSNGFGDDIRFSGLVRPSIGMAVDNVLRENIKFTNHTYSVYEGPVVPSSQYIGFEDVKVKVEEHYKKDIDKAIADYEESKENYEKLRDSVEERVRDEYSNVIAKLKKDNKLLIEKYEKSIEDITKSKDTEIKDLQDKVVELSKSKEEKVAELTAIIEDAQKRLEEIYGLKKKGLFKSIVEKWKK